MGSIVAEMGWKNWPSLEQLKMLSDSASDHFFYAASALQWIEQQIQMDGAACQSSVFTDFGTEGLHSLDSLYHHSLMTWENLDLVVTGRRADMRRNRLKHFRHVMGMILVLQKPFTVPEIAELLSDIPSDEFNVEHFLQPMRSVLVESTTTLWEEATPRIHPAFQTTSPAIAHQLNSEYRLIRRTFCWRRDA